MHGHKKTSHLPIRYFLPLLWAHPILHVSRIRVNILPPSLWFEIRAKFKMHEMKATNPSENLYSFLSSAITLLRCDFWICHVSLSFRLSFLLLLATNRFAPDGYPWNYVFCYSSKLRPEYHIFIQIWQK